MSDRLFAALQALPDTRRLLSGNGPAHTAATLRRDVTLQAERLRQLNARVLAVLADNGTAWVIADLAALQAGVVQLPLPGFFSDDQLRHALQTTAADLLLTDQAERISGLGLGFHVIEHRDDLILLGREIAATPLPAGTAKISFTSGSTGKPKGVCLSAAGLLDTAEAVATALADLAIERHLAVLPLALLLENVAGIYAPLLRGSEIVLPKLAELGWRGMGGGFNPQQLVRQIVVSQPNSLILVPELLKAATLTLRALQQSAPASLQFVAVGGARCDTSLIESARAVGLPAYEGYGMTECGSVVSLNRPGADLPGSVGKALPHVGLHAEVSGELHISNRSFLGYLHAAPAVGNFAGDCASDYASGHASGDLGHIDGRGFVHLAGRRDNLIITAYGRNIAPEWVEAALLAQPEIAQAVVAGETRGGLAALLVPQHADASLAAAVTRANASLPDYARVADWQACAPFTPGNDQATGNGRPIRAAILRRYANSLANSLANSRADALATHHLAKETTDVVL
jgi:long-subunit acyl-CoA synthetase (AMP-forming)